MKQKTALNISIIIIMLMFFPPLIPDAMGRAISGDITYKYQNNEIVRESTVSTSSNLEQRYRLNYNNYIFSPNLISYSLSGSFMLNDGEADSYTIDSEAVNYNLSARFLQRTKVPFIFSAHRSTATTFDYQGNGSPLIEQTTTSMRLTGDIKLRRYPKIQYFLLQDDRERTGSGGELDQSRREVQLKMSKKWKNAEADLRYNYRNTNDRLTGTQEDDHSVNLSGRMDHRISSVSKLTLWANAWHGTQSDESKLSTTAMLGYTPSGRFRVSNKLKYTQNIQADDTSISITNTSLVFYRITRKLRSTGRITLLSSGDSFGQNTSESAHGALSYADTLPMKISFSADTNAGYNVSQSESGGRSDYSGSASSSLGKSYRKIKTTVSADALANYSNSSDGDSSLQYKVAINASNNYIKRLEAKSKFRYSVENNAGSDTKKSYVANADLKYFIPFGWRARMNLSAGALFEMGETEREIVNAAQQFRYVLLRNLFLNVNTSYWMDVLQNTTSLVADAEVNYRLRRIFVVIDYEWRMDDENDGTKRESKLKIEVTRRF